jgi:GTP diphosphokinase / guanosine-3',5'-bis(diphosphate) 3'-diphosphatase
MEEENDKNTKTIKALADELTILMRKPSEKDRKLIEKACAFAKKAHEGSFRFSGEPFFNHVFATALELAKIGMDAETISAGLLHDSVEDTKTTREDIEKEFGEEVLFLVDGVTKLGELRYRGADKHIESLRRLFVATSKDVRVLMIKLMDRLHNMRTLSHVPEEKKYRIAKETLSVYAPLADRLGMGLITKELQDLAFSYIDPQKFENTKKIIEKNNLAQEPKLEKVKKILEEEIKKQSIKIIRIDSRIKGVYSLYKKLERKGNDVDEIYDVLALRIVGYSIEECYKILGMVHMLWRPLPGKIKDYIASPKPNGYRSIHTTVMTQEAGPVEVQIRTHEMHSDSEYGIASHLSYKENGSVQNKGEEKNNQIWYRSLIPSLLRFKKENDEKIKKQKPHNTPEWIQELADAHEKQAHKENEALLKAMEEDFFVHRIFVFTPNGDVVDLPLHSSPVDFAYSIHSDIGNHIAGARVNGKFVALNSCLKNGDIVEIETKKNARPSLKWVEYAKTTMAKKHIRQFLKEKEQE